MKKLPKKPNIYLDYASTTPIDPRVTEEIMACMRDEKLQGNPSSLHTMGLLAKAKMEESREAVAGVIGADKSEIIFTGSGTEADNLAILGIARAYKHKGNHIIVSSIEHKAVLESAHALKKEGFEISIAPVDCNGFVIKKELIKLIKKETILISVMYVNNETGAIQPIAEIARAIQKIRQEKETPFFHTDACQAPTVLPVKIPDLQVDLLTLNGAKIYGPKGTGMLYVRRGVKIAPITHGGDQERAWRPGTENVALLAGFATALSTAQKDHKKEWARLAKLQKMLAQNIMKLEKTAINSPVKNCSPSILNASFSGIEGESLLLELDHYGIYCSTGSACASLDLKPSYVLLAMHKKEELAHMSLRFSFGKYTTAQQIKYVAKILPKAVDRIRKICLTEIQ